MKRSQIDIIKCALIATVIFTLILISVYVYRFHHGLSHNHNDFADFGSYLGSITGLLAFIGVLYTIKDSQINRQIDNERSTFYNLLRLYQHQVDINKYTDHQVETTGIEAFKAYAHEARSLFHAYVIYHFIKDGEEFPSELTQIGKLDEQVFQEIYTKFGVHSTTELNALLRNRDPQYYYDTIYEIKDIIMTSKLHDMYRIITASICNRICTEKRYQQLYTFIRNIGDYLYGQYGQYLGQYHRNIYYLLDSIQNFKYPNDYSKIFRAQLSSDELTVILFNSMSSQSTLKTISLLKKFDIFNNIIALDLPISGYDTEKDIVMQTISSLFHEFITDSTNK